MARRAKTFLPPAAKLDATVVPWGKGEKFYRASPSTTVRLIWRSREHFRSRGAKTLLPVCFGATRLSLPCPCSAR